jgi:hypothetical protein
MRCPAFSIVLFAVCESLVGCGLSVPAAELPSTPSLVGREPSRDSAVAPTESLVLRFDQTMRAAEQETFAVVVPFAAEGSCTVDLACEKGACIDNRCQWSRIDAAFVGDFEQPPLTSFRQKLVWPIRSSWDGAHRVLTIAPLVPWPPSSRLELLLGSHLQNDEGVALSAAQRRMAFDTDGPASAAPTVELLSPGQHETDVPVNLRRLVVGFSAQVRWTEANAWLSEADGASVRLEPAGQVAPCAMASCFVFLLPQVLAPLREWRLEISGVRDDKDRALFVGHPLVFATGSQADAAIPQTSAAPRMSRADGCLMIDLDADEPSDLTVEVGDQSVFSLGRTRHRLAIRTVEAKTPAGLITLADLCGNHVKWEIAQDSSSDSVAKLVISEVLADPAGPEPAQEWVELKNTGAIPIDLEGFTLDDRDDGVGITTLPKGILQPGQFALIVGKGFQSGLGGDPPVAPGTLVLQVDGRVGASGLANSGESIVLRDSQGRLVSRFGADLVRLKPANGQSIERISPDACDVQGSWRLHPGGKSSPGR